MRKIILILLIFGLNNYIYTQTTGNLKRDERYNPVAGYYDIKTDQIMNVTPQTPLPVANFLLEVALGRVPGYSLVHKFGRNEDIGTSLEVVSYGATYPTPISPVSVEFVSTSVADALDSTGVHELTIMGLDANWDLQTVVTSAHATDGTVAVAVSGTWLRIFRVFVSKSGTYATTTSSSQKGTITVQTTGGGTIFSVIPVDGGFGLGQSLIGAYTVPNGYTAYLLTAEFGSDISGTKTTDFYFFQRENADDVEPPYSTMRAQEIAIGTQGLHDFTHLTYEAYPAKTDIGFMSKASASTDASVEFELLLVQDGY